jgi:hypothetical protein
MADNGRVPDDVVFPGLPRHGSVGKGTKRVWGGLQVVVVLKRGFILGGLCFYRTP